MTYDFNEIVNRRGTNSYKWDSAENSDVLPLWVADMDFRTAPAIVEALRQRVDHGVFGYTRVPHEYYSAVTEWFARRHGWHIERDWIIYTSGVVPAISAIIKALTHAGDKVLVLTPAYNCFFSSIRNNDCVLESCRLKPVGDSYEIDFDALQRQASAPDVKLMLLCNPHNPTGRVWTRSELERVWTICKNNDVIVVSDEIHCELVMPGYRYTPFASISHEAQLRSISCISPSKSFNIAGLQIANIVCADEPMRRAIDKAININEVCDVNPFGVVATIAAYGDGEEWLTQLIRYIHANYAFFSDYCRTHLPQFPVAKLEGTYLAWMDCRTPGIPSDELEHSLLNHAHLWLNSGAMYGAEGEGFMRWNLACPRATLESALKRFADYVGQL